MCMVAVCYSGCVRSEVPEFKPQCLAIFHLVFHLPPTSPTSSPSYDFGELQGCEFKTFSHKTARVQVSLLVPTPLAVKKGLFSCEFLARLQKLCLHDSLCLLSANAYWLCQVRITSSRLQENLCMCA